MAHQHEADIAWDLVEEHRDSLTDAERSSAYVHLGVDDYPPVVATILTAVARAGDTLPSATVGRLRSWIELYEMGPRFSDLLARVDGDGTTRELSA